MFFFIVLAPGLPDYRSTIGVVYIIIMGNFNHGDIQWDTLIIIQQSGKVTH